MGVGWYYLGDKFEVAELVPELAATESAPTTIVEPVVEAEIAVQPEVEPVSEVVAEIEAGVADEQVTEAKIEAEPETRQGAETETSLEVGQGAETEIVLEVGQEAPTEIMLEADNTNEAAAQDVVTAQASTVADTEVVIVAQESSAQQQTTQSSETAISVDLAQLEPSGKTRFQRELDMSYNWVTSKEKSVGTMQIMMLSFKTFDEAVYYKYVESLASKRVDTSQLRVFKTSTGGAEFYSVFYGEYASWQAAKKAKNSLPEVLRKTSPIARSVGGILKEIRRLEAES
jgi:septal ring-binding cell division protein DamX